jgi:hypothetical protein
MVTRLEQLATGDSGATAIEYALIAFGRDRNHNIRDGSR